MRSLGAFLVIAVLMMTATAALGEVGEWHSYRDEFSSVTYSGSNGSLTWEKPWYEMGEEDGPAKGAVHVDVDDRCPDYKCLHIFGEGQSVSNLGAKRYADVGQFETADLCYEITRSVDEELKSQVDADLLVQISADGGAWQTLASYPLDVIDQEPIHEMRNIDEWLGTEVGVRFAVTGVLGGEVFVDNVEIKGLLAPANTTTTTTKPTTTSTSKPQETTTTTRPATTTSERVTTTTAVVTTTTTRATTTTTSDSDEEVIPVVPVDLPPNSGLRATDSGVQVNFESGLFGAMEMGKPEVLGVELTPDYKMAVEIVEASWIWMIGLALVIAGAIVTGIDRRRMRRPPRPT